MLDDATIQAWLNSLDDDETTQPDPPPRGESVCNGKCPLCGYSAWVGLFEVRCTAIGCSNFDEEIAKEEMGWTKS